MTDFTLSHPDGEGYVWLMSGDGLREEMRDQIAAIIRNMESSEKRADRILSLPGICTNYGLNLGKKEDVAELFSQWLGSIDYLEDQ